MVNPEIETVIVFPDPMWNTRLFALPLIARLSAPGPEIVTFLVTSNSPLVKPMVPVTAKPIMSPLFASASAWRNESGPLWFVGDRDRRWCRRRRWIFPAISPTSVQSEIGTCPAPDDDFIASPYSRVKSWGLGRVNGVCALSDSAPGLYLPPVSKRWDR